MTSQLPQDSARRWRLALQYSYPIALGYVPAGIAYGVLMSAAGLPAWLSAAMSLLVYTGAFQYAAVALLSGGAGVLSMSFNAFVIGLRHVFYGLPLLDALPARRWERLYSIFALTDETFSVLVSLPKEMQTALMSRIAFLNQMYWLAGTLAGALIGSGLTEWVPHLAFALPSLLVILAYEQFRANRAWWPCLLAALAFVAASHLSPQYTLFAAVLMCAAVVVLRSAFWKPGRAA